MTVLRLLSAAFVLLVVAPGASAEEFVVGQGGFDTIQSAIDEALANEDLVDTVLVPPASYDESVAIVLTNADAQQKLTLRRKGKGGDVLIRGQGGAPALTIDGPDGVELRNLVLDSGNDSDGVSALLVTGTTRNVEAKNVHGVPGDDVGVIVGPTAVGVRLDGSDFSGMLGIGFLIDGASHTLDGCRASACGLNGIVLRPTSLNCIVEGAVAVAAGLPAGLDPGVISIDGTGHQLRKCVAGGAGAGGDGFHVEGTGHLLTKCDALGNGRAGFNLNGAVARLEKCEADQNLFGVQGGGQGAVIEGGSFDQNSSHGVLLLQPGTLVRSISAEQNVGNGVYVQTGVVGSRIEDCRFEANGAEGLFVLGSFTWVEGNVARDGDGLIDAGPSNSGRDNKVKGSGTNDF